jgi:hypothetical protein
MIMANAHAGTHNYVRRKAYRPLSGNLPRGNRKRGVSFGGSNSKSKRVLPASVGYDRNRLVFSWPPFDEWVEARVPIVGTLGKMHLIGERYAGHHVLFLERGVHCVYVTLVIGK